MNEADSNERIKQFKVIADDELFVPIKGYEGTYSVSNYGRIISHERVIHFGYGYRVIEEKELKHSISPQGYHRVNLLGKSHLVHRLVAIAFVSDPPFENAQINHIDGNKSNNTPQNLEWCTSKQNINHAINTGLRERVPSELLAHCSEHAKEMWKTSSVRDAIMNSRKSRIEENKKKWQQDPETIPTTQKIKPTVRCADMEGEIWKAVDGLEEMYAISNCGRVKSLERTTRHKLHGEWHIRERILKQNCNPKSGCTVALNVGDGKMKTLFIPRAVATAFVPNPNCLKYVKHLDGDFQNNRADNLSWCSHSDVNNLKRDKETGRYKTNNAPKKGVTH